MGAPVMSSINTETIARLADEYERKIVAVPLSDLNLLLRKLVLDAMEIGSTAALETVARTLSRSHTEAAQ